MHPHRRKNLYLLRHTLSPQKTAARDNKPAYKSAWPKPGWSGSIYPPGLPFFHPGERRTDGLPLPSLSLSTRPPTSEQNPQGLFAHKKVGLCRPVSLAVHGLRHLPARAPAKPTRYVHYTAPVNPIYRHKTKKHDPFLLLCCCEQETRSKQFAHTSL